MKNPKRRSEEEEEEDRLSELADSVIFLIFRSVLFIDVVRTSILSKRWRNLWTTVPFLNFDYDSWSIIHQHRGFGRSVNQFLSRWKGVRILELRLCYDFERLRSRSIDFLVGFAIEKGVEDVYLHDKLGENCWVPQRLFFYSSLKLLSIEKCKLRIDGIVQWNKLKKLVITEGFEVNCYDSISQILSGSPLLEVFELSFLDKGQNLNIRSNSLKELSIHKNLSDIHNFNLKYIYLVPASELTIWAPNLKTLRLEGIPFGKCGLIDVPSSTHVTIGLTGLFSRVDDRYIPNNMVINCIEDRFDQILEAIQHVESVELICGCIQVLGDLEKRKCIYSKVKSLVVRYRFYGYEEFIGPLKLFSQLSRLVLQWYDDILDLDDYPSFRANLPESFQLQLRSVDITWSEGDGIFPFIEFLLKYADKLEKMVFRVKETSRSSSNSLSLAMQELVRMPRSSPACKILTIPYN